MKASMSIRKIAAPALIMGLPAHWLIYGTGAVATQVALLLALQRTHLRIPYSATPA
jgi:hypothetical protein